MDKAVLVERDIDAGAQLVEALDKANVPVFAALWLYSEDANGWRFVIATPLVDEKGPQKVYLQLHKLLDELKVEPADFPISLRNASVVSPNDDLIRLLCVLNTRKGISRIRFTQNVINGVFIEDALIYRVDVKSIRSYRAHKRQHAKSARGRNRERRPQSRNPSAKRKAATSS